MPALEEPQPSVAPDSSSLSAGARALVDDRDAAVITASAFARYALGKLGLVAYQVPQRYTDKVMNEIDTMALTWALDAMWFEIPSSDQLTIAKDIQAYTQPDATSTSQAR